MASARCVHCGTTLEPNTMYCFGCGQLVGARVDAERVDEGWIPRERRPARERDPEPAREAAPAPAPATSAEPERRRRSTRAWSERVALRFSTGEEVVVGGSAVIGRRPEQAAANMGAQAIEIEDTTRSVSRVHLYLSLEGGRLRIGDAGSSNGSAIERGERMISLEAGGDHVDVVPGDSIWVGDVHVEASRV
ncbi:FHA domain-containing protein [Microbacterium sp. G2-8]|uniref:FHA domain-containing protein n=1 Tax=Microbacterium sp. G2-8 TaxID=2842454 RepID=UPI001C89494B|nr:FHA domain-containing protein [Microbacterium sp. G2-8]